MNRVFCVEQTFSIVILLSNFSFFENSISLIIIIRLLLFLDYLVGPLFPFVGVVQYVIF